MKNLVFIEWELNLFKLKNSEVVHIQTEWLQNLKSSVYPEIPCYVQTKTSDGTFYGKESLASISEISELSIDEVLKYYDTLICTEKYFEIREF